MENLLSTNSTLFPIDSAVNCQIIIYQSTFQVEIPEDVVET